MWARPAARQVCSSCAAAQKRELASLTAQQGLAQSGARRAAGAEARSAARSGAGSRPLASTLQFSGGSATATNSWRRGFHGSSRLLNKDYYEVLGVGRDADEKTLKKRYRELAKKYHPDSSSEEDATARFQEITQAYEVLSNPEKRQAYDNFGPNFENMGGGGGGGGFGGFGGGGGGFGGFEDFFSGGFSQQGGGRAANTAGEDLGIRVNLTFDEAVRGTTKTVNYLADIKCSSCSGSGAKEGESPDYKTCSACNGQGVRMSLVGGFIQVPTACEVCQGAGRTIKNKCSTCSGSGVEKDQRQTMELDIPAGVDNGMTMTRAGLGSAGVRGGRPGNLVIEFGVLPDKYFRRRGADVYTDCTISLAQAVLGGKVPVRTLDGEIDLKVATGVNNGETHRLRNKGISQVNRPGARGDHFVKIEVEMPTELTDRQRELMKEFQEEEEAKKQKSK
ncbi:DnaJ protein-like [Hondaea fermentalgiana]|uniref:DnaJ protein-like n=1 Tax=Hondaea fermentalgiana TaxID=2315210 RepID=A0A2R5GSS6_9STRA|nr:DnaJ protein-like [Hondaea fermentalgiana]|eukprot:GBG31703.1 DnaJ protein-like [Hondaea fermentalgiana]